jgi:hypothetical protein
MLRFKCPGTRGKQKNEAIYRKREMDGVIYRLENIRPVIGWAGVIVAKDPCRVNAA